MLLGIDVGGTNLDGVLLDGSELRQKVKLPIRQGELLSSLNSCLDTLLADTPAQAIERINLSTTVCTNAIVEGLCAEVGLIVQQGPGLNYDFSELTPHCAKIKGYVDHRGKVVSRVDRHEVEGILEDFHLLGLENLAVVSKFSPRNHNCEDLLASWAAPYFKQISLGHQCSGILNYPRRVNTAYLNSAVATIFQDFARKIQASLKARKITAPLNILKADGGTMPLTEGLKRPVETILSGPAASFMGLMALLPNQQDAVLLDIGGTTTDIFFVVEQSPLFEPLGAEISKHKTLVRALYAKSLGCGGDSVVRYSNNRLFIGPQRKGPCLALGGPELTPSDALNVLGLAKLGEVSNSKRGIHNFAAEVGLGEKESAEYILRSFTAKIKATVDKLLQRINAKPLYTVREVLEQKKLIPQELRLIGAPAAALAPYLSQAFDLPCSYPQEYAIANALGAALAIPSQEISLLADTGRGILSISELGIYEKIPRSYDLPQARARALQELGSSPYGVEITEEESFNMIEGFQVNKNIRIKAQVKPGLERKLYEG